MRFADENGKRPVKCARLIFIVSRSPAAQEFRTRSVDFSESGVKLGKLLSAATYRVGPHWVIWWEKPLANGMFAYD